ncbi:MAG: tRNA pseudouridine(55) synthase TruB [Desulfosalsimonadaceae bacterium]
MKNPSPGGIVLVDKPEQMSSAAVVARIKKLAKAKKAGHTGTLDPEATGLLLCPVNKATRLSRFFLHGWKSYEALLVLGVETDTQDAAGRVTERRTVPDLDASRLEAVIQQFQGEINQIPPAYSALKHKGRPLYEYARSGRPVHKPARQVTIERIALQKLELPEVALSLRCSSGTYIRSLCAEIGRSLGCGAYLKKLRRTENGGFNVSESWTLAKLGELADAGRFGEAMIPPAPALRGMPVHTADNALTEKIKYGKMIYLHDVDGMAETGYIKILDAEENLLAVLCREEADNERLKYCCVFHHG